MIDQRTNRRMRIAAVDRAETDKNAKRNARKIYERNLSQATVDKSQEAVNAAPAIRRSLKRKQTNNNSRYNTVKINKTSQVADRHNVNDMAVSEIVSAVLTDFGVVNESDSSKVIDRKKIGRSRQKNRLEQFEEHEQHDVTLKALYFDSRIDVTKTRINNKLSTAKKDHYSLLEEPGSYFLGFFTATTDEHQLERKTKAEIVRDRIISFLNENMISIDDLKAIGCDGTNMNTGIRGRRYSLHGTISTNPGTMDHLFDPLQRIAATSFIHRNGWKDFEPV